MEALSIAITVIIGLVLLTGFFLIVRKLDTFKRDESQDQSIVLLQKQITELTRELNDRMSEQNKTLREQMSESNKTLQEQFAQSSRNLQDINKTTAGIVKEVTEKLTKLDETNKQVVGFADQLQSLENILKNPKQRGILGEYFLETLLGNLLPPSQYKMQFKFNDGEIVDAAIFVKDKIIPIDAKFSLENYNKIQKEKDKEKRGKLIRQFKKDLKERIDETSKYIRPDEKTVDFAFMFIPAEGIYYNLLVYKVGNEVNSKDLIEYAFSKRVIIVSPNSFFAYLQTVLQALNTLKVQEKVQEIIKNVVKLQGHIKTYDENMLKLGKHLGTTVSSYNSSYKEFKKIDKDITKISGEKSDIEPMLLDKPQEQ
ncbi:DNA recombination protein RmuC [Candidatus Dojkabacteria bacterium]|nr:DNA recombination protein RmuC [Candidatus Dojkabacteria bacterium]